MWVEVTGGPAWAIGMVARLDRQNGILEFTNHMGSPHWYNADDFAYDDALVLKARRMNDATGLTGEMIQAALDESRRD